MVSIFVHRFFSFICDILLTDAYESLDFSVDSTNISDVKCYNVSIVVSNFCDQDSNCSDVHLQSEWTTFNNSDNDIIVSNNTRTVDVVVDKQKLCSRCSTNTGLSVGAIVAIFFSVVVAIAAVGIIIWCLFYYTYMRKRKHDISK